MLDLRARQIYMDALRPPVGYSFDRAIGTTYSLDLATLLVLPFSFALFECESAGEALGDRIKALQALRRHSEKITIFCQKGQISIPHHPSPLYLLLERMVVQVSPKTDGVFHPKVWAIRYTAPGHPTFYKLIVLSRNLTFDRSWDTALVLEGEMKGRVFSKNNPLRDFLSFLPTITDTGSLDERSLEDVAMMSEELRHVDFAPPSPFDEVSAFEPLGIRRQRKHPMDGPFSKLLVVSPFVDDELKHLSSLSRHSTLISRAESLDSLDVSATSGYEDVYLIDDSQVEPDPEDRLFSGEQPDSQSHCGLHAKLFIAETATTTDVWTGSANATKAAFGKNVEFLVRLRGPKSKVNIRSLLEKSEGKAARTLGDLLMPYDPAAEFGDEDQQKESERYLERAKRKLASLDLRLNVNPTQDGNYDLILVAPTDVKGLLAGRIDAKCWPITLQEANAKSIGSNDGHAGVSFENISFIALTTFVAFELRLLGDTNISPQRFVLNLPCSTMPEERKMLLLSQIICDQNKFLQFLLLLLSEISPGAADALAWLSRYDYSGTGSQLESEDGFPVMEELVRAYSRSPETLEELAEAIRDLKKSSSGAKVFPVGWETMWAPFEQGLEKRRSL